MVSDTMTEFYHYSVKASIENRLEETKVAMFH